MPAEEGSRGPSPVRELSRQGVAGSHSRLTDADVGNLVDAVVAGDRSALLGFEPFYGATAADLAASIAPVWGWSDDRVAASVDPGRTLAGFHAALDRIAGVAETGGRVAFATGRPSSLLPLYLSLAGLARSLGAEVVDEPDTGPFIADGRRGRRLRWLDGVAVVTDGAALLAGQGVEAGPEWAFHVGYPDLWVADHGFAAAGLRAGGEIAAFVDFDAVAVAAAAVRMPQLSPVLVPLDDQRSPQAYRVLTDLVSHRSGH